MPNRLASETSPYLLQHADNPVDWYPWGDEAFSRARDEDKPVLVSIGYAACHWCHVMEHESFEDASVADVMNARFVCVKVDREERPDVDAIYMDAVQAMTGQGGWPLNAFLTPDRRAVLGRHVLPACAAPRAAVVAQRAGRDRATRGSKQRDEIEEASAADRAATAGRGGAGGAGRRLVGRRAGAVGGGAAAVVRRRARRLGRRAEVPGLECDRVPAGARRAAMPLQTLRRMAAGGIYDQIGGGFARYSVDAHWLVPHFEKMLYDNALLARAYLHACQVSGDALFRRVCEETLDWAMRELRQDEGGFASSLDADTEGVEGKFYVWTPDEIRCGAWVTSSAPSLSRISGSPREGTSRAQHPRAGDVGPAVARGDQSGAAGGAVASGAAGVGRQAADVLERADDLGAGRRGRGVGAGGLSVGRAWPARTSSRESCAMVGGGLLRTFNRGRAKLPAFLEDHAYLLEAYLTLVRVDVRRALVRARGRARRHDLGALLRPGARRLLLHRRRPHRPDRPPQGPRGRADPVAAPRRPASACCGWRA